MRFKDAYLDLLQYGYPIKRKEWDGYWIYNEDLKTVEIHLSNGEILNMNNNEDWDLTLSNVIEDDWTIAIPKNCPILRDEQDKKRKA